MTVSLPHRTFNAALRDGSVAAKIRKIMEAVKPECAYFTELDGKRTVVLVVNLADASQIPPLAEPWFLTFEADVQFRPAMVAADLERAGLDAIAKQWG
ncbi:MAG TPA: hypothetical protein VMH77_07030 [Steroidobacteraceae bacterium]|nr:hypothetical protein [Steroidobacteraceae bacterium]